jgi:hypothetical protein
MKIINTLALLSIYSLSFASPILANSTYKYSIANKLTCQKTIDSVQNQFGSASIKPAYSSDIKYLKGRDMSVLITLSGKDVPKAYKLLSPSSKLLKVSKRIYASCSKVGMIEFVINGVDDNVTYAIVNEHMKEFTCARSQPIRWGEHICS